MDTRWLLHWRLIWQWKNPDLITGLILLAESLAPRLDKPRWYNGSASMGMVFWFLGPEMQKANREVMKLEARLENMCLRWADI